MEIHIPKNIDAELITLGTMLSQIDAVNFAMEKIESLDFSSINHQKIFGAMHTLYKKEQVIKPETVYQEMEPLDKKNLAYLYEIAQYKIEYSIDLFVKKIKDASKLRRFLDLNRETLECYKDENINCETVFENFNKKYDVISYNVQDEKLKTIGKIFENYQDSNLDFLDFIQFRQEQRAKGISSHRGITCGLKDLDNALSGFCKGHFIIIGARPGEGKTTFMLNLMLNLLKKGTACLFFSMEMTSDEVVGKLISIDSGIPYKDFEEGNITPDDYQNIVQSYHEIKNLPLYIEDSSSLTPQQIKTRLKRNMENRNIEIVFIDYLTKITPPKTNTREEGVRDVSDQITKMAKTFKIPFVCAAQENRESEKGDTPLRKPKKSDLGQSGGIEQDAHSIIMLRRPEIKDPYDKPGILEAYIVKNRFGEQKKLMFQFVSRTGKIKDYITLDEQKNQNQENRE